MKNVTKINQVDFSIFKKTRVAAYCRVSTDSDEQELSLETQKNHYESYIKANSEWEYAGIYYDDGVSGTVKKVLSILSSQNPSADLAETLPIVWHL